MLQYTVLIFLHEKSVLIPIRTIEGRCYYPPHAKKSLRDINSLV